VSIVWCRNDNVPKRGMTSPWFHCMWSSGCCNWDWLWTEKQTFSWSQALGRSDVRHTLTFCFPLRFPFLRQVEGYQPESHHKAGRQTFLTHGMTQEKHQQQSTWQWRARTRMSVRWTKMHGIRFAPISNLIQSKSMKVISNLRNSSNREFQRSTE
jgi:hypothetical protein